MYRVRGFSLIELMIAIAIVAILTTLAVPSYQSAVTRNRISAELTALTGDMQYSRSEALRAGQPVVMCTTANPAASPPTCDGSGNWQNGWIVFSDALGTGEFTPPDVLLRQQQPFTGGLLADSAQSQSGLALMSFNRMGFPGLQAPAMVVFHDSTNNAAFTRCVTVSVTGYITTEPAGDGSCR